MSGAERKEAVNNGSDPPPGAKEFCRPGQRVKKGGRDFVPGHPKVGGRKKGVPNKATVAREIQEIRLRYNSGNLRSLDSALSLPLQVVEERLRSGQLTALEEIALRAVAGAADGSKVDRKWIDANMSKNAELIISDYAIEAIRQASGRMREKGEQCALADVVHEFLFLVETTAFTESSLSVVSAFIAELQQLCLASGGFLPASSFDKFTKIVLHVCASSAVDGRQLVAQLEEELRRAGLFEVPTTR